MTTDFMGCSIRISSNINPDMHRLIIFTSIKETGPKTFEAVRRMFDEAKVAEQPMQTAKAILSIADIYSPEILEKVCEKVLRKYYMPYYKTIYAHARNLNSPKERTEFQENNKKSGIIRGADYYRKGKTNK